MNPQDEFRFATAVAPLQKEDFWKKRILDAGCGNGYNSFWAVRWGAREVVAFDEDAAMAEKANVLLSQFGNTRAGTGSLYANSYSNEFDMVLMIDTLSRIDQPARAVQSLAPSLKKGGLFLVRVASFEESPWYIKLLSKLGAWKTPLWTQGAVESLFQEQDFSERHLFAQNGGWTAVALPKK